ncbi:MAG: NAD-dependent epimerase/dehydratase family protein [Cellulophaga sp.]
MRVLVTGSQGFIGKNLLERLGRINNIEVDAFSKENSIESLTKKVAKANFIFHLAGVNRPKNEEEFFQGNRDLTQKIVDTAIQSGNKPTILMTSSTQVEQDNSYGQSKLEGEKALKQYAESNRATIYIYRLPNVFGKWSKPNYNTVIATWCHNITHEIPIQINNKNAELNLVYIDDVVEHFVRHLDKIEKKGVVISEVSPAYRKTLGAIYDLLTTFKESRQNLIVPNAGQGFERALYATYLSFLPSKKFSYALKGHVDKRGTFYEFIKTSNSGQISISTTAPGISRGNHYHNTKNEKFLVIKGQASIKHRQIHGNDIIEYNVSDKKMEVVEMIPGYTHNITNTGDSEMVLLLWANESLDHDNPDTNYLMVSKDEN